MIRPLKSQVWGIYNHATERLSLDEMRSLSLTFYEAAERLKAAVDHKVAATADRVAGKPSRSEI